MKIQINNSKCKIFAPFGDILELRENPNFKLRHPGFFHAKRAGRISGGWDGWVRYITEAGMISTGLLPKLLAHLKEEGIEYTLVDNRLPCKPSTKSIGKVGNLELRDYQLEAVESILTNTLEGFPFIRGTLWEATNSGKNLIAAAICKQFSKQTGIFLINNKTIFDQAVIELEELLPDEVGIISSNKTILKRINVCMVQTLGNRLKDKKVKDFLNTVDLIIVDEGDEVINRKDTQKILGECHYAPVRVNLTGTSGISRDKIRNMNEISFFGPIVHRTTNKQLVDKGHSAKPTIVIYKGNTDTDLPTDYPSQYQDGIIYNKNRNKRVWARVAKNLEKGRAPVLVLIKYHAHIVELIKTMPKEISDCYVVKSVHHKTKNKEHILQKFKDGKVDILICSMIIRRGKNLPLMRVLINAASGSSQANTLQIFGRGLRLLKGKKERIRLEDFYDEGKHLRLHSKRRIRYYKAQQFPVKEIYATKKP